MIGKVYSVGYECANALAHVKKLMDDPKMLLIDTRLKPYSWRANWTDEALRRNYKDRYRLAGQYLGNLNYNGGPIKIKDAATGIKGLVMYLREGHDLIVLCKCHDYAGCHRKAIAQLLLQAIPEVEIQVYNAMPDKIVIEQPYASETPDNVALPTMKALSIQQPWTWLIAAGFKGVENREWNTNYRGPVLLHAGGKVDSQWFERGELSYSMMSRYSILDYGIPERKDSYATGAIIGVADLVNVVTEMQNNRWFCGTYGLVFSGARLFKEPVLYKGQLNLFNVPTSVVANALKQTELPEIERHTPEPIKLEQAALFEVPAVVEHFDKVGGKK